MPNNDGWQDEAGWQDEPPATAAPQQAPMSAPKLGDFVPDSDTLGKGASGIVEGLGNMASSIGRGALGMATHPVDTMVNAVKGAGKSITDSYDLAKQGQIVPAAARAMSLVGFDEPKLAQEWNQGHGAHAVGEATPAAVATAIGGEKAAGDDLEMPKMEAGQMPSMPKASMPLVRGVFHDLANKYVGPRLANAILPEPTPEPTVQSIAESPNYSKIQAARALARRQAMNELSPKPELGSPENPGWVAPLPNKMPSVTDPVTQAVREGRAARIPSKMPSVTDPVTQAVREGRASAVPTRMPEQTAQVDPVTAAVRRGDAARLPIRMPKPASITEASPNPLRGMQSTSPSEVANLPPTEVRPSITSSPESTTGPSAKVTLKGEKTPKSSIVSPDSPAPKVQGSYWSFKESALRQAVLGGDRDAAMVYKERFGSLPEGASYLTDVGNKPNRGLYRSDR